MLIPTKEKMAKSKNPGTKSLSKFLKVSGFEGNIDDFAQRFLSVNKSAVYYQFRAHGDFDLSQKRMIYEQMKDGKNRQHGIKDESLPLLERILKMKIPRGGDIKVEGDNVAINNSSVSVGAQVDKDYKKLYKMALIQIEELKKELLEINSKADSYKEILNEWKKGDK